MDRTPSPCVLCGWNVYPDESHVIQTITHPTATTSDTSSTISAKNGDIVCDTCYTEKMCERCGSYDDTSYESLTCEDCKRFMLVHCGCVAVSWCQSSDTICRDCVLLRKPHELVCESCNRDLRVDLSEEFSLCKDAKERVLCMSCDTY